MARRKKSSETGKEIAKTRNSLEPAYSGKAGGNKHVIYADVGKEGEKHRRVIVLSFLADYAARRFIDVIIGKDTYEWVKPIGGRFCIETESKIRISMYGEDALKRLLDLELSEDELAWRDPRMEESALRLKFGATWEPEKKVIETELVADEETGELVEVKKKKKKEPKEKKEKKPKIDKTGMVTATELAAKLKIEPRIFRGALRALGLPKPEGGWMWEKKAAKEITEKVTKQLNDQDKKKKKK